MLDRRSPQDHSGATATLERATLLDGREIGIRPIRRTDGDALVAFHEALSPESCRLRFFTLHPHLSATEVERFTTVDHCDRQAFVAVGSDRILGVGRYDRVSPTQAEVAFVVADEWHQRGIATLLLDRLAHRAREVGINTFFADTLPHNRAMLDVFRHWASSYRSSFDGDVIHVEMTLG